ncbi:hypothetical protein Tco_0145855 [Tanacetum coccineum]
MLAPGMYNVGRAPRNHSSLPAKSANARRVEAHHRTLNKRNRVDSNLLVKHSVSVSNLNNVCDACNKSLVFATHNDCLGYLCDSMNFKPHQDYDVLNAQPKKEWIPIKECWEYPLRESGNHYSNSGLLTNKLSDRQEFLWDLFGDWVDVSIKDELLSGEKFYCEESTSFNATFDSSEPGYGTEFVNTTLVLWAEAVATACIYTQSIFVTHAFMEDLLMNAEGKET